jgi:hypothetical protein
MFKEQESTWDDEQIKLFITSKISLKEEGQASLAVKLSVEQTRT